MKFSVEKKHMLRASQLAARIVPQRASIPILHAAMIRARGGTVSLTATDLEVTTVVSIPAEVEAEGNAVVPARILLEIIESLPDGLIQVQAHPDRTMIYAGRASFEISGFDPADYPVVPEVSGVPVFSIDSDLLRSAIRRTIFAASNDFSRPNLTGVYFSVSGDTFEAAATDGSRLSVVKAHIEHSTAPFSHIIPRKAAHELTRILAGMSCDVHVFHVDGQVAFVLPDVQLLSRTIAGTFPEYHGVIPTTFVQTVRASTNVVMPAIRRARITSGDNMAVRVRALADSMTVMSNSPEIGRLEEQVPVRAEGETVEVAFNAGFLLDALEAVESDEVELCLAGSIRPALIRPAGSADYICVIAPLKIY